MGILNLYNFNILYCEKPILVLRALGFERPFRVFYSWISFITRFRSQVTFKLLLLCSALLSVQRKCTGKISDTTLSSCKVSALLIFTYVNIFSISTGMPQLTPCFLKRKQLPTPPPFPNGTSVLLGSGPSS